MNQRIDGQERAVRTAVALAKIARTTRPYFVCPDCCRFSSHPDDAANSYCGNCHQFKFMSYTDLRCFEPSCPDFGSYDFGEGTCPEEHAIPAARRDG